MSNYFNLRIFRKYDPRDFWVIRYSDDLKEEFWIWSLIIIKLTSWFCNLNFRLLSRSSASRVDSLKPFWSMILRMLRRPPGVLLGLLSISSTDLFRFLFAVRVRLAMFDYKTKHHQIFIMQISSLIFTWKSSSEFFLK